MPTLKTGRSHYHPPCFEATARGELFIANGLDDTLRVKGMATSATIAGIVAPADALSIAASGSGTITGTYTAYVRFVDADGIPSSLSPLSSEVIANADGQIDYTDVPSSTNTRVTKRQIFRNTDGQVTTYYLDVEIDDNTTTTATGTKTDAQLVDEDNATYLALPILNPDGTLNANRFEPPPHHKAVVVQHADRMWFAVDVSYQQGNAIFTNASTTVEGVGTAWTANMLGRRLFVPQIDLSYEITAVSVANQTLTIDTAWDLPTGRYGYYSIEPDRNERNKIYFSYAGEPESVPEENSFLIQEIGGDELTGLMPLGQFLFALMRRHIYRISFAIGPADDISVQKTAMRGCLNQRCWVRVEDTAFLLDREGVYKFGGGYEAGSVEHISEPVQDLFRENRINWEASRWFFASHNPTEEIVRFHVALGDSYLPTYALCYHYRHNAWSRERFPWMTGGACIALMRQSSRCLLGSEANTHYLQGEGLLDGPLYTSGEVTTRGTATSATFVSLSDTAATFPESTAGSPLSIVAGKGKGQTRRIASVSGSTLTVKHPWIVKPDTTSVYQIGGVEIRGRTGLFPYVDEDSGGEIDYHVKRRLRLHVKPTLGDAKLDVKVYDDHESLPRTDWVASDDNSGVVFRDGEAAIEVALKRQPDKPREGLSSGLFQIDLSGGRGDRRFDHNWVSVELSGWQDKDPLVIYSLRIDGVEEQ